MRNHLPRKPALVFVQLLVVMSAVALPSAMAASAVLTNFARQNNGSFRLETLGTTGMVYSLQVSSSLTNWRTLDFTNSSSGHAVFLENAAAAAVSNRYYRIRLDSPSNSIWFTNYHGWTNSIIMRNAQVEVAIVPAVGRIMQFRFLDQADGPFWENSSMYGTQPAAGSWNTPGSFGGDKVWPSPQTWPWPPPRGFDSMPFTAGITNDVVTLTGPVDATFGTRVVRRITLHPTEPILRVTSTFEKVSGSGNRIGVWVITQLREGQQVFMPVPKNSIFPTGYKAIGAVPAGLVVTNGLVALSRDPNASTKIGNDAGALLWVGNESMLLIESPRIPGVAKTDYPDSGSSAEIYTNPNPTAYLEMELLAPLVNLGAGNTAEATSVYSLFRRTRPTALDEAITILAP